MRTHLAFSLLMSKHDVGEVERDSTYRICALGVGGLRPSPSYYSCLHGRCDKRFCAHDGCFQGTKHLGFNAFMQEVTLGFNMASVPMGILEHILLAATSVLPIPEVVTSPFAGICRENSIVPRPAQLYSLPCTDATRKHRDADWTVVAADPFPSSTLC